MFVCDFVRLADFHLAAFGLLTISIALGMVIRQPAKRLAIAWATTLALGLLLGLVMIPGWSVWSLGRSGAQSAVSVTESRSLRTAPNAPVDDGLVRALPRFGFTDEPNSERVVAAAPNVEIDSIDLIHGVAMLALPIYLVGTLVAAGWLCIGWWLARRLVDQATDADPSTRQILCSIASAQTRLLVSDCLAGPVAIGLVRPTILLPQRLVERSDAAELRLMLAHELAHICGRDLWLLAGLRLLLIPLWCNPLYWLLRRRVRLDQETVADAVAVNQSNRRAYAERLVRCARDMTRHTQLAGAAGLWEGASQLRKRIDVLLDDSFTVLHGSSLRWRVACTISCLAFAVIASLATLDIATASPDEGGASIETTEGLTYAGVVVDKRSGKPIEGAQVLVRLKSSSVHPWPTLDETSYSTGADGRYEFTIASEQLADSLLYIEVEATHPAHAAMNPSGYGLRMIRKNQNLGEEPFFARIELRPAEPVYGVLLAPDGKPAAGVSVLGYSQGEPGNLQEYGSFSSTETDEKGRFRLNMVAGGHSVVWFHPHDFAPATHVLKERKGNLGNVQLESGVRLSGQVVDINGKPIPGIWVNAELRSGPAKKQIAMPVIDHLRRSALTDATGRFEMRPLPAGTYKVLPGEHPSGDPSVKNRPARPLHSTFLPQTFELADRQRYLDIQAVESVTLRARTIDSDGQPTRGHGFHIVGRVREDGGGLYFRNAMPDPQGNVEIRVPKGLKKAQLNFTTNEHGALRIRLHPDQPLVGKRKFELGTLDRDYNQIEIVRYKAPILLVEVLDPNGERLDDITVSVVYTEPVPNKEEGTHYLGAGEASDVGFEHQDDNRWRSSQLLPEEPFELHIETRGKELPRQKLELAEDETRVVKFAF